MGTAPSILWLEAGEVKLYRKREPTRYIRFPLNTPHTLVYLKLARDEFPL